MYIYKKIIHKTTKLLKKNTNGQTKQTGYQNIIKKNKKLASFVFQNIVINSVKMVTTAIKKIEQENKIVSKKEIRINKISVLKSPFVNKKSNQHFSTQWFSCKITSKKHAYKLFKQEYFYLKSSVKYKQSNYNHNNIIKIKQRINNEA